MRRSKSYGRVIFNTNRLLKPIYVNKQTNNKKKKKKKKKKVAEKFVSVSLVYK